jgi:hypothetical protein
VYYNKYDKSNTTIYDLMAFVEYSTGPLEIGVGAMFVEYGLRPEGNPVVNFNGGAMPNFARGWIPPMDRSILEGWIYLKYSNGRFFFNAEADWHYGTVRWQRSMSNVTNQPFRFEPERVDGSGSIFRPLYTESWRYMVEFGAISGPVKVALLYAYVPGPDRRHGVLIDRQPVNVDLFRPGRDVPVYNQDHGNSAVFRPYSMLLNTAYGSGLGAIDRAGNGFIVDASVLAARLDYAVAANLNLFGSFLYAKRVSHGHGWGYIRPMVLGASPADNWHATRAFTYYNNTRRRADEFGDPSPAIPDNNLGWEVDLGVDWALLEGWNLSLSAGYWQPGRWFTFACIDKSVPNWDNPSRANRWGTNPDRLIDPIFGLNFTATLNF